jgi:hypothetical protein
MWGRWVRACGDLSPCERYWLAAERSDSLLRGEALLELVRTEGATSRALRRAGELAGEMAAAADARVRAPACAAVWLLGEAAGAEKLLADLASADWPARFAACRAAAAVREPRVVRALARLLGDESSAIRAAAYRSLVEIRGAAGAEPFDPEAPPERRGPARAAWKRWADSFKMPRRRPRGKSPR